MSLLRKYGWHEWLCHTNFSFLTGASHPHELIERASDLGYRGISITDYDGVYGLARSYRAWQKQPLGETSNLRLFYGAEVHLEQDHSLPLVLQNTVTLLAQSRQGYANLCRLLSYSHRDGKHGANIPLGYLLQADVKDLVIIYPMRGLLRQGNHAQLYEQCEKLKSHFNGRIYFALGRYLNPLEDVWIKPQWQLAQKLGADTLLSQDVFMHESKQKDLLDVMQAMRVNKTLDESSEHLFVNSERSLHRLDKIEQLYSSLPMYEESLRTARELSETCQFSFSELRYTYPKEMIPEGHSAQSYLEEISWKMANERYFQSIPDKVEALIAKELKLIKELGFADYFLTVWDIVRWAREQNILCQGRGSAANSAVCYMLGVTAVDPSMFDVLFERFISAERGDPPDIDVDFEHERREEVIQYIYSRYGRSRAGMVANVITFKTRGAMRFVGKALGMSEEILSHSSKILSSREYRKGAASQTLLRVKEDLDIADEQLELFPLWAELAGRIKGFPRHLGIHSGGFMIADRSLDELVAQEPATMEGRSVIQWCKEDIEALGFFKIDVLALGMLTAVRKCLDAIRVHYHRDLSLTSIPQDDPKTYQMIQRADTVGTFQIESRAQMSMLPRLRPKDFYDLVIEVAIIRPGPIQGGMIHPFLKRRNGEEKVSYAHPSLVPILRRTMGIPIFQEQVMRVAMAVGDFTPGEADELRRNMGAWQFKGDLSPWIEKLVRGMRRRGIEEVFIDQLIGQFNGFADYGFPESHAASFALIAYVSSYLKCHYPAAFCLALLNSQPMGFYSPNALIQEVRRHGVEVLPICVGKSDWEAKLETVSAGGYGIRLGLAMVAGMREQAGAKMLLQRDQRGGWAGLDDFLMNSGLARADLTSLAAAGALELFGVERRGALWLADAASFSPYLEDEDLGFRFPEETAFQKIQQDFRATSTSLGEHPALIVRRDFWCFPVPKDKLIASQDLQYRRNGESVSVFGLVLVRQAPPSAKGMVFFTLEDERGYINLVFTPQVNDRFRRLINSQGFLCVSGKLQRENEGHSILVRTVYEPNVQRAEVIPLHREKTRGHHMASAPELSYQARNYM